MSESSDVRHAKTAFKAFVRRISPRQASHTDQSIPDDNTTDITPKPLPLSGVIDHWLAKNKAYANHRDHLFHCGFADIIVADADLWSNECSDS